MNVGKVGLLAVGLLRGLDCRMPAILRFRDFMLNWLLCLCQEMNFLYF